MKNKISNFVRDKGIALRAGLCSAALAVQTGVMSGMLMADEKNLTIGNDVGLNENMGGANLVVKILDIVVNIFILMGAFFVVSGIYKLVMAYKDNQPEQQNTAIRDIVIGVVMVVFRLFLWNPIAKVIFSGVS